MSFNFGNFDFSNLDLSGLDADYFANLAKTTAPAAPVDPIQEAISNVAPPVSTITPTAVIPKVDSLDQAITPISSDRTTTQLFPDYGVTPQQGTNEPVVSETSASPYYGVTTDQRNRLNEEVISGVKGLPKNEFGQIDLTAGYKEYSDKLATGDLSFLKDAAENSANIQSGFQYGLTPEQQKEPWSKNTTAILGEAVNNLNTLKETNPQEFESTFQSLTPKPALAFLYDQAKKGEITKEEHAQSAVNFLRKEQPDTPFFVENGKVYSYPAKDTGSKPHEIVLTPDNVDFMPAQNKDEYFYNTLGTMSKKPSEDFDIDAVTGFLNDPVVNLVGAFLPPVALATTAAKAANGQTLHAGDWLTLASAGLEQAGAIKPPSAGAGGMGPIDNGVGLFGTTYDQTQNIMEAAAAAGSDGNPAEILIKGFGVTDDVLDKIGIDSTTFDNSVVDYGAFVEGVEEAASRVAGGDNIEDAIKAGALDYIVEAAPDIDLGVVTDAVKAVGSFIDDNIFQPIIETVGDIDLGEFEDTVRDLGREFDDEVLQEIKGGIEEFAPQVEDFVKTVGGATVEAVEAAGGLTRDVIETVGGEVLDALKPIGSQLEDIAKATGSTVEDVLKGVAGVGEDVLSGIGDVGQDVIDALGPLGTQLEDIAKATGSTVEDVIKGVAKVVETSGGEVIDALEPIGTAITDIAKVTGSTVEDVLKGVGDLTEDLGTGLVDAIETGGKALEDFIKPIGETVADIAKATGSTVEDVLKGVASVGEDIIGEVGDVGQDVIDALKPLGSTLEDFAKATGSTLEDVLKDVGGLGEDILGGVADVGSEVIDAVKASGLSTEGMLQSGFENLSAQQATQAADARRLAVATRTTDSLFSDFKGFETEIGGTPIELVELIQRNRR